MEHTVVGVYDSYAQAESAMNELLTAGFSRENVQLRSARSGEGGTEHADAYTGSGIGHFFRTLFGGDEEPEQGDIYAEAVRRGACVLTAGADNEQTRDLAVEIMNRHDPVDMDERAVHWRSQGWSGYDEKAPPLSDEEIQRERAMYAQSSESSGPTSTTSEEQRVPVVEEELRVGKTLFRSVESGFYRAFSSILDSNVTTLIACGALFWLGSGLVKGFALTLAIGVLTSMFTAVTCSRTLLLFAISMPSLRKPAWYCPKLEVTG